jgi:hypothetical protein
MDKLFSPHSVRPGSPGNGIMMTLTAQRLLGEESQASPFPSRSHD